MNGRHHLISLGLLLAAIGAAAPAPARAADEWLGAAQMFGGASGGRAVCYFTNLSTAPIILKSFNISSNSSQIALAINECGSTAGANLGAGRTCAIAANTGDDIPYSCATLTSDKDNTRGGFELRSVNPPQTILNSLALE